MKRLTAVLVASLFVHVSLALSADGWSDNYQEALALAKKENKPVLINFTGSDWCGWCIKLKKDVFSTQEFQDFAKNNVVLFEADFPQSKKLPQAVQEQNEKLQTEFKVDGYPTLVLVNAEGKELDRNVGYLKGGPEAMIAWIKASQKK